MLGRGGGAVVVVVVVVVAKEDYQGSGGRSEGQEKEREDYRPISLLSVSSKVIEKIGLKNVYHLFDTNILLS